MNTDDQKEKDRSDDLAFSANKVEFVEGNGESMDLDGKGKNRRRMESRVCEAATQPKVAS